MEVIDGGNRLQFGRATGSLLALVTTAKGAGSNFHVPRLEGWTRTETDQRATIRLVKRLFLYCENSILPISVPGLLEKHML